jgi:hypothetical protein
LSYLEHRQRLYFVEFHQRPLSQLRSYLDISQDPVRIWYWFPPLGFGTENGWRVKYNINLSVGTADIHCFIATTIKFVSQSTNELVHCFNEVCPQTKSYQVNDRIALVGCPDCYWLRDGVIVLPEGRPVDVFRVKDAE